MIKNELPNSDTIVEALYKRIPITVLNVKVFRMISNSLCQMEDIIPHHQQTHRHEAKFSEANWLANTASRFTLVSFMAIELDSSVPYSGTF